MRPYLLVWVLAYQLMIALAFELLFEKLLGTFVRKSRTAIVEAIGATLFWALACLVTARLGMEEHSDSTLESPTTAEASTPQTEHSQEPLTKLQAQVQAQLDHSAAAGAQMSPEARGASGNLTSWQSRCSGD